MPATGEKNAAPSLSLTRRRRSPSLARRHRSAIGYEPLPVLSGGDEQTRAAEAAARQTLREDPQPASSFLTTAATRPPSA